MATTTSELYKSLLAKLPSGKSWFEYYLVIQRVVTLYKSSIVSIEIERSVMEKTLEVGHAIAGKITAKIRKPNVTIPRRAGLTPFIRLTDGVQTSEWWMQGSYHIDTREESISDSGETILTLVGYDGMLLADQEYPATEHDWPCLDTTVVNEIAQIISFPGADSRTYQYLTAGNMVEAPTGYTMREVLENIAAENCGNFVMTNAGRLLFVPLYGLDAEEWLVGNYLADENGNALTLGSEGWCILV